DGIRDLTVTGVQTCALPIYSMAVEGKQFRDLDLFQRAIEFGYTDLFAGAQRAIEDARDRQPTEIIAVVQVGHQHLQHTSGVAAQIGRASCRERVENQVDTDE